MIVIMTTLLVHFFPDGVPSPPTNLMATITSATSIALSWEYPGGPEVDSFEINYFYIISECTMRSPPVMISVSNSSQRSYTIVNDSETPVEEDSGYPITLNAINSAGRSSANVQVTTPEAGMI